MPLWDYDNKPLTQLESDCLDVYCNKTKKLEDFPADYRVKIISTWRFSASRHNSKGRPGLLNPETLDPI